MKFNPCSTCQRCIGKYNLKTILGVCLQKSDGECFIDYIHAVEHTTDLALIAITKSFYKQFVEKMKHNFNDD